MITMRDRMFATSWAVMGNPGCYCNNCEVDMICGNGE